jgi:hypothetical protein
VAAVGLGAGSVACYRTAGQAWTFYEIDPAVVRIASDPRYFTYLKDCALTPASWSAMPGSGWLGRRDPSTR